MSTYQNLPGQLMEFKDGGLALRNDAVTQKTGSVLILGTAIDGPKDPVAVSLDTVEALYGSDVDANGVPNGSTITKAFSELYRAGCTDIRVQKISGNTSKTVANNITRNESVIEKVSETLDLAEGNDITTLTLSKTGIIPDSIKVYAKDALLSIVLDFTPVTKILTIPAGITDAGVNLSVKFDYTETEPAYQVTQTATIGADKKIKLDNIPNVDSLKILYNEVEVDKANYAAVGDAITFTKLDTTSVSGKTVKATYTMVRTRTLNTTENSGTGGIFKTATSVKTIQLIQAPKNGTFHLYSSDTGEAQKNSFTVSGSTLSIKKEFFTKNSLLSVSYFVEKVAEVKESINFESYFTSAVYDAGLIEISDLKNASGALIGKKIAISKPDSKRASNESALEYTSLEYPTFKQLVDIINKDMRNGVYRANTDYPDASTSRLQVGKFVFDGGNSGINTSKDEIFKLLCGERDTNGYLIKEGLFQLLENYSVDFVYLTGVYADDMLPGKFDDFAYELALYCAAVSHTNKTTYGCIDFAPCKNTSLKGIREYVDRLCSYGVNRGKFYLKDHNGKMYTNSDGKPQDIGQFIRVFGGPEPLYLSDTLGLHPAGNGAAWLGLQTTIAAQSSPMNKALPCSKGLRYSLSKPLLDRLTGEGIITFMQKYDRAGNIKKEAFVTDSMTAAHRGSDYVRTTSCEVVKVLCDDIREIGDPYIGEPPTTEKKNAFAAALSKRFSQRKLEGVAIDISFEIVETATDLQIGDSKVLLSIVPPLEKRRITTMVGLRSK